MQVELKRPCVVRTGLFLINAIINTAAIGSAASTFPRCPRNTCHSHQAVFSPDGLAREIKANASKVSIATARCRNNAARYKRA